MKVRVKATGEVLNVAKYAKVAIDHTDGWGNIIEFGLDEIELIPDEPAKPEEKQIDWEQRRYEIAKECVANMIQHSVSDAYDNFREQQQRDDGDHSTPLKEYLNYERIMSAHYAIEYADELIKQMQVEK